MNFSSRKVESSLQRKGFVKEPGDHRFFYLYIDGLRTNIRTKTSHNGQDIDDGLIKSMSKQVQLTKKEFILLIQCPLTKEKYIQILKDANKVKIESD